MFRSLVPRAMEDTLAAQFETSDTDINVKEAMLVGRPWHRREDDTLRCVFGERGRQPDAHSRGAKQ